MSITFQNGFGIGASNNGGGGGPLTNCNPTASKLGTLSYNSGTTLTWTDDTSGYTFYNGGYNAIDDGYSTNPVTLPTHFYMNCTGSTNLFISTNGGVSFEVGTSGPYPANNNNSLIIGGSPGDLWLQDGLGLNDGTNHGAWYRITDNSNTFKIELKVFHGRYQATTTPYSYQLNLYKDSTYQWVEAMSKVNFDNNNCGPSSSTNVSQPNSTTSKVWRSSLGGNDWQYMGEGSVQ